MQVNGNACFSQGRQSRLLGTSCVRSSQHRRLAVPSCCSDKHHQMIKGPSTQSLSGKERTEKGSSNNLSTTQTWRPRETRLLVVLQSSGKQRRRRDNEQITWQKRAYLAPQLLPQLSHSTPSFRRRLQAGTAVHAFDSLVVGTQLRHGARAALLLLVLQAQR